MVFGDAEQVIDHLEPLCAVGVIDTGDFHQLLILVIVAQHGQHIRNAFARNGDTEFANQIGAVDDHATERGAQDIECAFRVADKGGGTGHILIPV